MFDLGKLINVETPKIPNNESDTPKKADKADEADEADQADQADQEADHPDPADQAEVAQEVQEYDDASSTTSETRDSLESGRAATAGVKRRRFSVVSEGREIVSFRVTEADDTETSMTRPTDPTDPVFKLWRLWETDHRKLAELKASTSAAVVRTSVAAATPTPTPTPIPTTTPAPALTNAPLKSPSSGLPQQVWESRPLARGLYQDIESRFFIKIVENTHDCHGNAYVPPNGEKGSTPLGRFPHAIVREQSRGVANTDSADSYICAGTHNITVGVQLMEWRDGKAIPSSEYELLDSVRKTFTMQERANHGHYESNFVVHFQLEFAPDADGAHNDCLINADDKSEQFSFKKELSPRGTLLVPPEQQPYSASNYEKNTERGKATCSFRLSKHVTTGFLSKHNHGRQFCIVARVLNPFFQPMKGMTCTSVPFQCKAVMGPENRSKLRYVSKHGNVVLSPIEDVSKTA